jgi:hypothetical protein
LKKKSNLKEILVLLNSFSIVKQLFGPFYHACTYIHYWRLKKLSMVT